MSIRERPSTSSCAIRRAGQMREESKRPWCWLCRQHAEAPGNERPFDWLLRYGHRDRNGAVCSGEWVVLGDNVVPMRRYV